MNYPMYGNNQFMMNDLQNMRDRIDNQMRQIQQNQIQQPIPQVTQNFQITPTQNNSDIDGKYAENIDDVKNTFVIKTTLFINKDNSQLWIKDVGGNIKTFGLEEIIELDEKDKKILELQKEIKELKGEMTNDKQYDGNANVDDTITSKKPTNVQYDKSSKK